MKTLVEEQKYPTAAAVVTALNVLIASGFTIQGFVSPKSFLGPEAVECCGHFFYVCSRENIRLRFGCAS
jgi:hypothetical protein